LTRSRLDVLTDLTRALGEAIVQGDLGRAEILLAQRRSALGRLELHREGEWRRELAELRDLEERLLDFCRIWSEALKGRLRELADGRMLRHSYRICSHQARFVDVRE
jgi:hypothetical protein